jgi:2,3-bisphosphoglycerate-dependent phosphoglycerate mutase
MSTLVLLRHGQSSWNLENRFTGWWDVDLSAAGEKEARRAGALLGEAELLPDVAHTSVLTRAIRTQLLALEEIERLWIPQRSHWRLNERHYGGLTGLDKAQTKAAYGPEQFLAWRRSYDVPPPPLAPGSQYDVGGDPRYAELDPEVVPATECLADVVRRLLPYWYDQIVPDLRRATARQPIVLVTAHGNSLRALIKHLESIADEDIPQLEIPTGIPLVYELDDRLRPIAPRRVLGDIGVETPAGDDGRAWGRGPHAPEEPGVGAPGGQGDKGH